MLPILDLITGNVIFFLARSIIPMQIVVFHFNNLVVLPTLYISLGGGRSALGEINALKIVIIS